MAACPPKDMFLIDRPQHRALLTSPLRLEMLEHFAVATAETGPGTAAGKSGEGGEGGGASIADIALRMGRRPDSLYYHVNALVKVGLLVPGGTRKAGKRDEALYRPVARSFGLAANLRKPADAQAALKAVAAAFRLAEREMKTALDAGPGAIVAAGPQRNFFARRLRTFTPGALRQINQHLDAIMRIASRERERGAAAGDDDTASASITIALLPSVRRPRAAQRPPRSS
jgi:hypothetical protein